MDAESAARTIVTEEHMEGKRTRKQIKRELKDAKAAVRISTDPYLSGLAPDWEVHWTGCRERLRRELAALDAPTTETVLRKWKAKEMWGLWDYAAAARIVDRPCWPSDPDGPRMCQYMSRLVDRDWIDMPIQSRSPCPEMRAAYEKEQAEAQAPESPDDVVAEFDASRAVRWEVRRDSGMVVDGNPETHTGYAVSYMSQIIAHMANTLTAIRDNTTDEKARRPCEETLAEIRHWKGDAK